MKFVIGFMSCVFIMIIAVFIFIITGIENVIGIMPLTVGILFLSVGILLSKKTDYSTWKDGKGKVVAISTHSYDYKSGHHYHSPRFVIEFVDERGNLHRGYSQSFKKIGDRYPVGTELSFKYKLGGPIFGKESLASIHIFDTGLEELNGKGSIIVFSLLGLLFIFLSILMFLGIY